MSCQQFKTKSRCVCVCGRHFSTTVKIEGDKTPSSTTLLIRRCVLCSKTKSRFVFEITFRAEGLGDLYEKLGKGSGNAG